MPWVSSHHVCCPLPGASAGALPLTAPPPWSTNLRGTTGANKSPLTTGQNPTSNVVLEPTTKPRQWGVNSGFPHPGCHCTPCAPAGYSGPNLNLQGCLEVAPRSTSNHPKSGQYGQSLGTLIQEFVDQKFLEHAWQMGFLARLCKSN